MLYQILKQLVATVFRIYFRKIYLIKRRNVPVSGPILVASNHPMAFSEACLLACFLDRPLYFLVRGDVFKEKWQWFFKYTNQIPIYRFRDGFSNMRRNVESFATAHEALKEGKAILIFSEGNTRMSKRLFPLQKGTARLAFGAYTDRQVKDTKIVPVGINYTEGTRFRSEVMIHVGEPLVLEKYLAEFEQDNSEGVKLLTEDLHKALMPLIIHFENEEDEKTADQIIECLQRVNEEKKWPSVDYSSSRFHLEKKIADQFNRMSPEKKETLNHFLNNYRFKHQKFSFIKSILLTISLPLVLAGFLVNAVPFYLAKRITDKKVHQVEFYTPVRMGILLILYLIWLLLIFILLIFWSGWYALVFIWLIPLTGYLVVLWKEAYDRELFSMAGQKQLENQLRQFFQF